MSTIKKIVAIATSLSLVVMLLPVLPAQAATAEELQAQIAALQQQLATLQAQLSQMQSGSSSESSTATNVPAACVGVTFDRNLTVGMTGADVKCLQTLLNQDADTQLADSGPGSPGNETTYFGSITKSGVIKFQEKYASEILAQYGLTAGTGYVGPSTRAKLNSLLSAGTSNNGNESNQNQNQNQNQTSTTPTSAGLSVTLASDNPASATLIADTTSGDGAQALVPVLSVTLTNGDTSDVKVTEMKFTRSGISSDSDISQAYLYSGDTELAEYNSFSDGVLTFSDSNGLVTIPAGSSKTVTLKIDLANGTNSGKTIRFSVASESDITSDASTLNGTFPLVGNYMSTATTGDLGKLTVTLGTAPSAAVDPQDNFEVFNFNLEAADQDIKVYKLTFTNIGSTAADDLANFKLYDGGTQVGDAVANMSSDKTVTFDLTNNPLLVEKGVTKNMHVKADIVGGTGRDFRFSIQNMNDIVAYDTQYGVYIKPNQADSWTLIEAANASTINNGKLTISRASDSPSGNVPLNGTNVVVAKFDVKATGEPVKISSMTVAESGVSAGLYQAKVYFDGSQKGQTSNLDTSASFSFGNTFIVPADNANHTLEVKADIKSATGGALTSGDNFTISLSSISAIGKTSMQTVSVGTADGFALTVASGDLTAAKNQALADWSASTIATGVKGATNVLVGSFVLSGGAAEGADISSIVLKYATTTNSNLQNLKLYAGPEETGVQIGSTLGTFSANTNYTFSPSSLSVDEGGQIVLYVYADILTGASTGNQGNITLVSVSGTGKITSRSVSATPTDVAGQNIYIADHGTLGVSLDAASNPSSDILVSGSTGNELAKYKFSASTSAEAIEVTQIALSTSLTNAPTSTLNTITIEGDGISKTLASLDSDGTVTFDLTSDPWTIPAYGEKILTIKANIGQYPLSYSGGQVSVTLSSTAYKGAISGVSNTASASAANAMLTYRTKPTVNFVGPTSAALADGDNELLKFTVTADSNKDLNVYGFNIGTSLSDANISTSSPLKISNIRLYDASDMSTVLDSVVGISTNGATYTTTTYDNASTTNSSADLLLINSSSPTAPSTVMDVIPAGSSVTYVVKATVSGSAQYDSVIARVSDLSSTVKNAILWGDQSSVDIDSTYVKTLPTSYSSLSR